MASRNMGTICRLAALIFVTALPAAAQSFRVQCPTATVTHPASNPSSPTGDNNSEPPYTGPTVFGIAPANPSLGDDGGYVTPTSHINGAIKCQQVSGGDGYSTMANGVQTFMFSFGPLSGLADIAAGKPGTEFPNVFNVPYPNVLPGDPATTDGATDNPGGGNYVQGNGGTLTPSFTWNGAVGVTPDADCIAGNAAAAAAVPPTPLPCPNLPSNGIDGHVDPRQIMDVGVMNGNIPAPLISFDEDDEMFLTLTNVGMIMRPDLFEQHTIHFHGYPNASSVYDGVPDASVAINIGGSFTYYYLAPDAGTYFWHCHITPPEHMQMGMVGQLNVHPRQDRVPDNGDLYTYLGYQNGIGVATPDLRTVCNTKADILCSATMPAGGDTGAKRVPQGTLCSGQAAPTSWNGAPLPRSNYTYNDGDASTCYDVEYAVQEHGFDPNFHFVGMTFNPEAFADMKDKFFLLNGRSYPDTIVPGPMATQTSDGRMHYSQPLPAIINIPVGGKALIRLANLSVSEYHTLASLGIPMHVVGWNAKLLRDQSGNNTEYYANSVTLGGGESLDFILDASNTALYPHGSKFYLYTSNLDHLSNDQENFGGLMTEVNICSSVTNGVCN